MLFGESTYRGQYVQRETYRDTPVALSCILHVFILSHNGIHGNASGLLAKAVSAYPHALKGRRLAAG